MIAAAKRLPYIQFVFAGEGEYSTLIENVSNIKNVGFQTGEALDKLIREAKFSVCPSECYENCPFSVMESQERGTVAIGAKIGGIPELIREGENGLLFESGNVDSLVNVIEELWNNNVLLKTCEDGCLKVVRDDMSQYAEKFFALIDEQIE